MNEYSAIITTFCFFYLAAAGCRRLIVQVLFATLAWFICFLMIIAFTFDGEGVKLVELLIFVLIPLWVFIGLLDSRYSCTVTQWLIAYVKPKRVAAFLRVLYFCRHWIAFTLFVVFSPGMLSGNLTPLFFYLSILVFWLFWLAFFRDQSKYIQGVVEMDDSGWFQSHHNWTNMFVGLFVGTSVLFVPPLLDFLRQGAADPIGGEAVFLCTILGTVMSFYWVLFSKAVTKLNVHNRNLIQYLRMRLEVSRDSSLMMFSAALSFAPVALGWASWVFGLVGSVLLALITILFRSVEFSQEVEFESQ